MFQRERSPERPVASMNMLLGNPCGQSYTDLQIMTMLKKAGQKGIKRHPFKSYNDSSIVYGFN